MPMHTINYPLLSKLRVSRVMLMCVVILTGVSKSHAEDLVRLLTIALKNDAKYLSAQQRLLADKEIIAQTRADLLPSVDFQYEFKREHAEITDSDNIVARGSSSRFSTRTRAFTVTQSLFDYARWARYSQSKLSSSRAELEYAFAKQELLLRLAENYFLVLERNDQLDTVQAEKIAMDKHYQASKKKHHTGLGRRVDMEDALARYLNALSKEVELQSLLIDSQFALREVLGIVPESLSRLTNDLDPIQPQPGSAEEWVQLARENNLELRVLNLDLQVADKEVSVLESEHAPTIDLVFTKDRIDQGGNVFGGASKSRNEEIAVQLNVPLFSGGKTSSKVRQATAKRESVFYDRNDKRRAVARTVNEAFYRIKAAIKQIDALKQSVKAQQRLLDSKTSGYQVGQNSMLEILDVQQDLSAAQQSLTKARYDYVLNVLRLKFAAGDLQESDLVVLNEWLTGGRVSLQI